MADDIGIYGKISENNAYRRSLDMRYCLTLSPPDKLSSVKVHFCFNFQSASVSLNVGENVVCVPTYWIRTRRRVVYSTLVVIGGLRVKKEMQ